MKFLMACVLLALPVSSAQARFEVICGKGANLISVAIEDDDAHVPEHVRLDDYRPWPRAAVRDGRFGGPVVLDLFTDTALNVHYRKSNVTYFYEFELPTGACHHRNKTGTLTHYARSVRSSEAYNGYSTSHCYCKRSAARE